MYQCFSAFKIYVYYLFNRCFKEMNVSFLRSMQVYIMVDGIRLEKMCLKNIKINASNYMHRIYFRSGKEVKYIYYND